MRPRKAQQLAGKVTELLACPNSVPACRDPVEQLRAIGAVQDRALARCRMAVRRIRLAARANGNTEVQRLCDEMLSEIRSPNSEIRIRSEAEIRIGSGNSACPSAGKTHSNNDDGKALFLRAGGPRPAREGFASALSLPILFLSGPRISGRTGAECNWFELAGAGLWGPLPGALPPSTLRRPFQLAREVGRLA